MSRPIGSSISKRNVRIDLLQKKELTVFFCFIFINLKKNYLNSVVRHFVDLFGCLTCSAQNFLVYRCRCHMYEHFRTATVTMDILQN